MQLVDTNIISELMFQRPNAGVLAWAEQAQTGGGRIAISAITVDEIIYGLARRPHAAKIAWFYGFLARQAVLEVSETIARGAGELRAMLSLRGQVRSQPDMLIAGTARTHALTLVTRNVRDFEGCGIAVLNPFDA